MHHTPAQHDILQAIATKKSSATEIAKITELSLPYTLNQLALLEARGEITKHVARKQSGPGKPKKRYALTSATATISILKEGFGKTFTILEPSEMLANYLQILSQVADKNKAAFSEYFWHNVAYFEQLRGVGFVSEHNNTVEILALTTNKALDELRKHISNYTIKQKEYKNMRVACWVHTTEEILHGVKNHDDYYLNLVRRVRVLADPFGELAQTLQEAQQ